MGNLLKAAAAAILLGASLNVAQAQTQKTITFVSTPTGSSKSKKGRSHHRKEYGKNSLTVGALSYFDGFMALSYERMLTERFTIAVGLGATNKNLWMSVGESISNNNPGGSSTNHDGSLEWDVEDDYGDFRFRRAKAGLYASVCPKFYTNHESLDGTYVAPLIEFRDYRFSANKASTADFQSYLRPGMYSNDAVPRGDERVDERVRCFDVSAIWGGHYQLRGHIVIGYHIGLGFRLLNATRLDLGYQERGKDTYRYTNDMVSYSDTRLLANVGFSLGGWW